MGGGCGTHHRRPIGLRSLHPPYKTGTVRRVKLPVEELAPYLLPDVPRGAAAPPIVWHELFGSDRPVEVGVGFGKRTVPRDVGPATGRELFWHRGGAQVPALCGHAVSQSAPNSRTFVSLARRRGHSCVNGLLPNRSRRFMSTFRTRGGRRGIASDAYSPPSSHFFTAGTILRVGGRLLLATDVERLPA